MLSGEVSTRPVGFAVLGSGPAARNHAQAVTRHPGARLVAVHSRRPESAEALAAQVGCRATTDYTKIIGDPEVQAIIVANEPQRHILAVEAAEVGKHLLVEKPLAATLEDGLLIAEACQRWPIVASVAFQRRFGKAAALVAERLHAGAIGRCRFADVSVFIHRDRDYYRAGNRWRLDPCGGLVLNRLIHVLDLLISYFGPVRSVWAHLASEADDLPVETRALLGLEFGNRVLATVRGSASFPRTMGEKMIVVGDEGSIVVRGTRVTVSADPFCDPVPTGRREHLRRALFARPTETDFREGTHDDQLDDFLGAIREKRAPKVTMDDGLYALRIGLAAIRSHQERRPIEVAESP